MSSPGVGDLLDVRYARRGEHHIAYTVMGDGDIELVYLLGFVSQLDLLWDDPAAADFLRRLGHFSRLVVIDKRGTGLSDRAGDVPIPEEQVDDLLAVMDAVGFERPAILGTQDGFQVATLLAATHPTRATALIGMGAGAHGPDDYGSPERLDRFFAGLQKYWGREDAPGNYWADELWHESAAFRRWWARYSRAAAGPTTGVRIVRNYLATDIRPLLGAVSAPTLILEGQLINPLHKKLSRRLADGIRASRVVEVRGSTLNFPWIDAGEEVANLVEGFLTGVPAAPIADRRLATVLFTDVVRSTETVAAVGDHTWRAVLDRHDAIIRSSIERYRGQLVKLTGDGVVAIFDGPGRAAQCALSLRRALGAEGVTMRAGLHTCEIEIRGDDIAGLGVHIASRVMSRAGPGEVLTSSTVRDLVVGSELRFEDRGDHDLRGVPRPWRLFALDG